MGARDDLDRFYTPDDTARRCIDRVELSRYAAIIEPSAGAGAFSSMLPQDRTVALDIAPAAAGIEQGDWLETDADDISAMLGGNAATHPMLVIGNPPFGTRCSLAKAFIAHAVDIGADTIALILPDTFTKMTNQRCFPDDWRLAEAVALSHEECSFLLAGDDGGSEQIFIPCSFFVWTRDAEVSPGIDLRDRKVEQPAQFSYLGRGDERADFSVNGNNGHTKDIPEITNPKAEHYIRVSDGFDVKAVRDVFDSIDYDFKSSVNGGVAWVSQNDINKRFAVAWAERFGA